MYVYQQETKSYLKITSSLNYSTSYYNTIKYNIMLFIEQIKKMNIVSFHFLFVNELDQQTINFNEITEHYYNTISSK